MGLIILYILLGIAAIMGFAAIIVYMVRSKYKGNF